MPVHAEYGHEAVTYATQSLSDEASFANPEFTADPETARIVGIYQQAADVYRRSLIAMGRVTQYEVSVASTIQVRVPHEQSKSYVSARRIVNSAVLMSEARFVVASRMSSRLRRARLASKNENIVRMPMR